MIDNPRNGPLQRIADLIESRLAPALERIAAALERGSAGGTDPRTEAIAEFRRAIRDADLPRAMTILSDFQIDFPDDPEEPVLEFELAEAARLASDDLRVRLDAARAAGDAEAVLGHRDELAPLLDHQARDIVDRDVLGWIMGVLMKRLRAGHVGPDVAIFAARVAASFPHRPEGASLKASLPTLRRSAGLCARCAEPYAGDEDACPKCQAGMPKIAELPESPVSPA